MSFRTSAIKLLEQVYGISIDSARIMAAAAVVATMINALSLYATGVVAYAYVALIMYLISLIIDGIKELMKSWEEEFPVEEFPLDEEPTTI